MMANKEDTVYTVVRTDLMSGTTVPALLISAMVVDDSDKPIEVENGCIIEATALMEGEREIYKAKLATASSKIENCYLVVAPEVPYDERKKNFSDFVCEAGQPVRGYALVHHDVFSITKEGFVGGTVPEVGATVGIGAKGKIDASGKGLGTVIDIDVKQRYTYYTIRLA